jgi:hypothetical protein
LAVQGRMKVHSDALEDTQEQAYATSDSSNTAQRGSWGVNGDDDVYATVGGAWARGPGARGASTAPVRVSIGWATGLAWCEGFGSAGSARSLRRGSPTAHTWCARGLPSRRCHVSVGVAEEMWLRGSRLLQVLASAGTARAISSKVAPGGARGVGGGWVPWDME